MRASLAPLQARLYIGSTSDRHWGESDAHPHRPLGQQPGPAHPRRVAEELGVGEGGDVELTVEPGRLVVRPGPRRLEALLAGITDQNLPESFDDAPRGAERL